jgi:hypothetical protein
MLMLVVQIAAGVVLGVLVLAWLEKWARHAAEERWRAAQGRISRREARRDFLMTIKLAN